MVELAKGLKERGQTVRVAVFYHRGRLAGELDRHGIDIIDLRKGGRWDNVAFLWRLVAALRHYCPDVLYSFLGGANIAAATARLFVPRVRVAWSVRSSNMDLSRYDWLHGASYRLERAMSSMPDLIIANSRAGRGFAVSKGFPDRSMTVVPNGIDTRRFRKDRKLRASQRRAWKLGEADVAVGVLARLDPMKGLDTFLQAAAIALKTEPKLVFLCIGEGPERARLEGKARNLGIADRISFPGHTDPVKGLNALDIACSSSITEGFPNSVAEAMACELPCVVTDVGDSAWIVGETGWVVPPGDPEALAAAILDVAADEHSSNRGAAARRRILKEFSVASMIERTLDLLGALGPPRSSNADRKRKTGSAASAKPAGPRP